MKKIILPSILLMVLFINSAYKNKRSSLHPLPFIKTDIIQFPGKTHFANVLQLTFGGDNAKAYFSFDGRYLIF